MRSSIYFLSFLFILACSREPAASTAYEIPSRNHDLSYIPYDADLDNPDYIVCDSTRIGSGRNRLQYPGGNKQLREVIQDQYQYQSAYAAYNGYIMIRFLVNCEGTSGRYRVEALNLDFSRAEAPPGLVNHTKEIIKNLDAWVKVKNPNGKEEYSKFINLKIENGQIQHVLL